MRVTEFVGVENNAIISKEALSLYRRLLFCFLLAFGLVALSWATQGTNANHTSNSRSGTVTDQNGASFPGVTLTLTGTESRTQQTESNRNY
jgi:hypothetical protein